MSRDELLRRISAAALLAGVMLLLAGLYGLVIKAGVPYQDPTPEMQFRYAVDLGVGEALLRLGALSTVIGFLLKPFIRPKK